MSIVMLARGQARLVEKRLICAMKGKSYVSLTGHVWTIRNEHCVGETESGLQISYDDTA